MTNPAAAAVQAALFRKLAGGYDAAIREYQPTYEAMLRLSTDLAGTGASERKRCLDYGTGTGGALPLLSLAFDEVVAVDPNEAMLDVARARVASGLPGAALVSLVEGTVLHGAASVAPDGSFDAVHCSLVLMFVENEPEKLRVLSRFYRLLRPGGVLVLTELLMDPDPAAEARTFAQWRAVMRYRGADDAFIGSAVGQVHGAMHRCTAGRIGELLERVGFQGITRPFQALHTAIFVGTR